MTGSYSNAGTTNAVNGVRALFGMDLAELTELMAGLGQKPYRARQVWEALYKQRGVGGG